MNFVAGSIMLIILIYGGHLLHPAFTLCFDSDFHMILFGVFLVGGPILSLLVTQAPYVKTMSPFMRATLATFLSVANLTLSTPVARGIIGFYFTFRSNVNGVFNDVVVRGEWYTLRKVFELNEAMSAVDSVIAHHKTTRNIDLSPHTEEIFRALCKGVKEANELVAIKLKIAAPVDPIVRTYLENIFHYCNCAWNYTAAHPVEVVTLAVVIFAVGYLGVKWYRGPNWNADLCRVRHQSTNTRISDEAQNTREQMGQVNKEFTQVHNNHYSFKDAVSKMEVAQTRLNRFTHRKLYLHGDQITFLHWRIDEIIMHLKFALFLPLRKLSPFSGLWWPSLFSSDSYVRSVEYSCSRTQGQPFGCEIANLSAV